MADSSSDRWQVARVDVATNPQVVNISDGLTASETAGTLSISVETDGITSSKLDPGVLKVDTVTLTSAQVKGLRAAPATLVAAPGAGKMVVVESLALQLNYGGSNAFTETADNLILQYGDSGQDITAAIETTGFIDQTADMVAIIYPATIATAAAATVAVNEVVELFNTGDGEIAGNAGNNNTLVATIAYRVVTLA
jgi:hypothetical protein